MHDFHYEPMIYDLLNIQDNKYEYKVNINNKVSKQSTKLSNPQ